jgi:hypothetical protein
MPHQPTPERLQGIRWIALLERAQWQRLGYFSNTLIKI